MLTLYKELNYHKKGLSHILVLKDGRLSSSAADNTLIIYNKESFQPDLIIKEHTDYVNYHIQLENWNIVTCSWDHTLKIIKLLPNYKYEVIQELKDHTYIVDKALETKEGKLITCANDKLVIVWKKNKDGLFELEKKIVANVNDYPDSNIVFINDNLLLCTSVTDENIKFYEMDNDFQLAFVFYDIKCCFSRNSIIYISERDLLLVGGIENNGIYMFKMKKFPHFIGNYNSISINQVYSIILFSDGDLLVGAEEVIEAEDGEEITKNNIYKLKINEDNKGLSLVNKMENAHEELINGIIDWKERNFIVTCSKDEKVKIWTLNK